MSKLKVKLDFIALPIPEKVIDGEAISANFKKNVAEYPTPDVSLADFDNDLQALNVAYVNSLNNGDKEKNILVECEEVVDEDYRLLALYANRVTKGDEKKLAELGFHIVKPLGSRHYDILKVVSGEHSGTLVVKYHRPKEAISFIFQISNDGIIWTQYGVFSTSKIIVTGLTIDKRYYFRVAIVSSAGTSEFSHPVSKIVEY